MTWSTRTRTVALSLAATCGLSGCIEPISEPWASGEWGERLAAERTRTEQQQQQLRSRLENYAEPYR